MGQRVDYYDNIKGILIILVVFAHCLYGYQNFGGVNIVTDTIYVFHMPAFVFITGFLSKSSHSRSRGALLRLFAAYLIFNTLMLIYNAACNAEVTLLTPYNSCWYLLSVIAWRAVSEWAAKQKGILLLSVAAALAAGFFGDITNILAAARTIAFYPFFLAGFMLPADRLPIKSAGASTRIKGLLLTAAAAALAALFAVRYSPADEVMQMSAYSDITGLLLRAIIFAISATFILGICLCAPQRAIPFVTKMGRNSLSVYLLHRIITLMAQRLNVFTEDWQVFCYSAVLTAAICVLTGTDKTAQAVNRLIECFADSFTRRDKPCHRRCRLIAVITAGALALYGPIACVLPQIMHNSAESEQQTEVRSEDIIFRQLTAQRQEKFQNDYRLLFAGDLIMLENQVKRGRNGDEYRFDEMFEYTREYISAADLAIGVFEGPMAGEAAGYSTSNYDDGMPLAINYPDEFALAVKNAGFDLVTTANNHLLDKGADGALRTLDVLDEAGLDHTGSYRSSEEKSRVKIVEQGGMKFAVLAYTYGSNGCTEDELLGEELSYITSITVSPESPYLQQVRQSIAEDFARAKAESPDAVIVLSHMGTQFDDYPDSYQKYWYEYFLECGADVILNDHTHSVQPVEVIGVGKTSVIVNCPGNFANIYREHNGDASAMTEIYFDRDTKQITGAAVIPMWTNSLIDGNYRAVPIYDILNDSVLGRQLTTYDLERVEQVQRHITQVMLGYEIKCSAAENRYFITENGYEAQPSEKLALTDEEKNSPIFRKITQSGSVCFVGDSVTHGTKNGGFGWFRPLEGYIANATQCAVGGATSRTILPQVSADAQLYVVAIGTNDVRYRDETICAMSAADYISELEGFVERIHSENSAAEFVFIAPWTSLDNDSVSALGTADKRSMNAEYTSALKEWCGRNGHLFSNPNPMIDEVMLREVQSDYLEDYIHPNRYEGIRLYCRAVLAGCADE